MDLKYEPASEPLHISLNLSRRGTAGAAERVRDPAGGGGHDFVSSSLTSNLLKNDQLLTEHRSPGLQGQHTACEEKTAGEVATLNEVNPKPYTLNAPHPQPPIPNPQPSTLNLNPKP